MTASPWSTYFITVTAADHHRSHRPLSGHRAQKWPQTALVSTSRKQSPSLSWGSPSDLFKVPPPVSPPPMTSSSHINSGMLTLKGDTPIRPACHSLALLMLILAHLMLAVADGGRGWYNNTQDKKGGAWWLCHHFTVWPPGLFNHNLRWDKELPWPFQSSTWRA